MTNVSLSMLVQVYLKKQNATEETVATQLQQFKEERRKNVKLEETEVQEVISRVRSSIPPEEFCNDVLEDYVVDVRGSDYNDDNDTRSTPFTSPARGQGRGSRRPSRGRGESSRRGGGRGRGGRGRAALSAAEEPSASASRANKTTRSIKDVFSVVPSSKRSNTNSSTMYV